HRHGRRESRFDRCTFCATGGRGTQTMKLRLDAWPARPLTRIALGFAALAVQAALPVDSDPLEGRRIRGRADLGSETIAGPVRAAGKVLVGTNNAAPRDPKIDGDRGVLMVFASRDGGFLWQATHEKLPTGERHDWPKQGVCATPLVHGQRVYYLSNRC